MTPELDAVTFSDAQLMLVAHAIVRALKAVAGEPDPGRLAAAEDWMAGDTAARVAAARAGTLNARAEHERWSAAKRAKGYAYGEARNDDPSAGPLTHPLLVPFDELDLIAQLKDLLPNAVLADLIRGE